jgi:hypothetical protein
MAMSTMMLVIGTSPLQHLWQLGEVRRLAPRFVFGKQTAHLRGVARATGIMTLGL